MAGASKRIMLKVQTVQLARGDVCNKLKTHIRQRDGGPELRPHWRRSIFPTDNDLAARPLG